MSQLKNWKKFIIFSIIISISAAAPIFALPERAFAAASFYLSPASKTVTLGSVISASVMINTGGGAINVGEGTISFASDVLEFQSVSTSGSIFNFWTSGPTGSENSVSFGGGLANPGYNGSDGKVLTIVWKAKAAGAATVSVLGSKILANDGVGTNIYGGSSGGTFIVGEAKTSQTVSVKSISHPDSNAWYNNRKISLSWSVKSAKGYVFDFNQSASIDPKSATGSATSKEYEATADGVWYFHVKGQFDSGWGPVTHFKIQIDTVPPEEFTISINQEGGITNPSPTVTFEAKDTTSGIDHYEAIVNGGTSTRINSGDKLPKQRPGDHNLIVRAFDKAGNTRDSRTSSFYIKGIAAPEIIRWDRIVGLLEPVHFVGRSDPEDTLILFLGNGEVARFKASDFKISEEQANLSQTDKTIAESENQIIWQYEYAKPLMAGSYDFRFGRIDKNGAESELTGPLKVSVVSSTIKLFGWTIPTIYIFILILLIIIALVVVIILLFKKLRKMNVRGGAFGLAYQKIKHLFSATEKKVDQDIDETISSGNLSKNMIGVVKKDLKGKVHKTFEESEDGIKDQVQNNPAENNNEEDPNRTQTP